MRRVRVAVPLAVLGWCVVAALVVPAPAPAQEGDCELVRVGGYTLRTRFDSVSFVHHASGGIDYRCSDGMRMLADSAVVFESNEQVHLFGRVRIEDTDTELDADTAQYFGGLKQLIAWSNVRVTDRQSGAVISGGRLLYDQVTEVRPLDRMIVYEGQPHATVFPVARAEPPPEEEEPVAEGEGGEGTEEGEGAPVGDSVPAGDSVPVGDSVPDAPVEDTFPVGDSVPVQDTLAVEDTVPDAPVEDSVPVVDSVPEAPASDTIEAAPDTVRLPPYEIDAERFTLEGRRFFRAGGSVVVVRDSLLAQGDSLDYDQEVGAMSIIGNAQVDGRSYRLDASTVSVTPTYGLREELLARKQARLAGEQVDMTAPAIRMFLEDGLVNRLVAIGEIPPLPGEPQTIDTQGLSAGDAERLLALAEADTRRADSLTVADSLFKPAVAADQFNLTGDSIDVRSPGQVLDLVTAVGVARAEGIPDDSLAASMLPEAARRDWMEGDTIFADFVLPVPEDSLATPAPDGQRSRLETLTAVGSARSLYRLVATDSAATATPTDAAEPDTAEAAAAPSDAGATEPEAAPVDPQSDTTEAAPEPPPALHWVEGERIIVYLEGREVVKMDVEGQTVGYHLEPLPPGTPPDSTAVPNDSSAVGRPPTEGNRGNE